MKRFSARRLTLAALVGAMYVVLGYFGNIFSLTFGVVQCRFAEALTVLPFLFPVTAWGLFVGCVITNLLSPYGPLDMVVGSLATLIAALWTAKCRRKWLSPLPPVVCNGLLVGAVLAWQQSGSLQTFFPAFAANALSVALGEAVVCFVLGLLLLRGIEKTGTLYRR